MNKTSYIIVAHTSNGTYPVSKINPNHTFRITLSNETPNQWKTYNDAVRVAKKLSNGDGSVFTACSIEAIK